jgi:hypothetical protein
VSPCTQCKGGRGRTGHDSVARLHPAPSPVGPCLPWASHQQQHPWPLPSTGHLMGPTESGSLIYPTDCHRDNDAGSEEESWPSAGRKGKALPFLCGLGLLPTLSLKPKLPLPSFSSSKLLLTPENPTHIHSTSLRSILASLFLSVNCKRLEAWTTHWEHLDPSVTLPQFPHV